MHDRSVSRFWDNFIEKTISYKVNPKVVRWYVRHVEAYIDAHPDLRLSQHSPLKTEQYFREKGRNPHLQDWQFRQMVEALKILFIEVVKTPWARDFPWGDWSVAVELWDTHTLTGQLGRTQMSNTDTQKRYSGCLELLFDFY